MKGVLIIILLVLTALMWAEETFYDMCQKQPYDPNMCYVLNEIYSRNYLFENESITKLNELKQEMLEIKNDLSEIKKETGSLKIAVNENNAILTSFDIKLSTLESIARNNRQLITDLKPYIETLHGEILNKLDNFQPSGIGRESALRVNENAIKHKKDILNGINGVKTTADDTFSKVEIQFQNIERNMGNIKTNLLEINGKLNGME